MSPRKAISFDDRVAPSPRPRKYQGWIWQRILVRIAPRETEWYRSLWGKWGESSRSSVKLLRVGPTL